MFDYSDSTISALAFHYPGNKALGEGTVQSPNNSLPDETFVHKLRNHLLNCFSNSRETFKLNTNSGPDIVLSTANEIFSNPESFYSGSVTILNHLYDQSIHHHIKSGELIVLHLQDVVLEGEASDALGIFKVELKDEFLQLKNNKDSIGAEFVKGVRLKKVDKGCIIFNTEADSGYRVLNVDANNYDTQYWMQEFLNIVPDITPAYQTKQVVDLVQDFAQEVVSKQADKHEQTEFLQDAMNFMDSQPNFKFEQFVEEVVKEPEMKQEFESFKADYAERSFVPLPTEFNIYENTFQAEKKKVKNLIKLDTHIQIKIDFDDEEDTTRFIEKGFDEDKGMHYYTIYFNEETN
jgi:hypothetical protein